MFNWKSKCDQTVVTKIAYVAELKYDSGNEKYDLFYQLLLQKDMDGYSSTRTVAEVVEKVATRALKPAIAENVKTVTDTNFDKDQ
ncbi:6872_t:CDS:2 [Entrophospora sp. SA101]|nr:6872_t:CDS:2 [Entrophospora sp. SA101]